jgi:hypothetical protein
VQYSIEFQADQQLIVVRTWGDAALSGFKSYICDLLGPPCSEVNYNILADFRDLNMSSLTNSDIKSIADIVAANRDNIPPVKHALVVSTTLSFGLSRMYELLATERDPQTIRVFYDYDEARAWVCSDAH